MHENSPSVNPNERESGNAPLGKTSILPACRGFPKRAGCPFYPRRDPRPGETTAPPAGLASPRRCPALRYGQILHHSREGACPHAPRFRRLWTVALPVEIRQIFYAHHSTMICKKQGRRLRRPCIRGISVLAPFTCTASGRRRSASGGRSSPNPPPKSRREAGFPLPDGARCIR